MSLLKGIIFLVVIGVTLISSIMIYKAHKDPQAIVKDACPVFEIKDTTTNVIPGVTK